MLQPRRSPLVPSTRLPLRRALGLALGLAVLGLAGCSTLESNRWTNMFLPYRIEIVQGNVVTSEQVARVAPGMTRLQVREALGSPLLADMFHANRWDYLFMLDRGGTPLKRLDVTIYFADEKVARVEAPALPTDSEFIDSINPYRTQRSVPVLALTPEQIKALPLPPPPAVAASAPEGPQRSYPPLEPTRG